MLNKMKLKREVETMEHMTAEQFQTLVMKMRIPMVSKF